jgi:hypothetical protein
MKIPKKDYTLLVGIAEFHFKFAEYVRESDSAMFFRAIDYARTYTKVDGLTFDYWHEDNKKFLKELNILLTKIQASYNAFISTFDHEEEGIILWMKNKNTTKDDILGIQSYIKNLIQHCRELQYNTFDEDDWMNIVGICKFAKDEEKFLAFILEQMKKYLGEDSSIIKEFNNDQSKS